MMKKLVIFLSLLMLAGVSWAMDRQANEQLFSAVATGNLPLLRRQVEIHGADVNVKNGRNLSPLHTAAARGQENIVAYLIEQGADVNVQDVLGMTPLHNAVNANRMAVVLLLLSKGALTNLRDIRGHMPVSYAKTPEMRTILERRERLRERAPGTKAAGKTKKRRNG